MAKLPTNGRFKYLSLILGGEFGKLAVLLFFIVFLFIGLCSPEVIHHLLDVIHGANLGHR